MSNLKILALDIECSAAKVYTYTLHGAYINPKHIIEDPRIMCFSAQWVGSKKTMFFSEYHDGQDAMVKKLHEFVDSADIICGFNSERFDYPWIEGYLMEKGYTRPSPSMHIDLLKTFRKHTRFISRKLDYVSARLLEEKKIDANTMDLYLRTISDDEKVVKKAWAEMARYNKRDVTMMPELFERVKSYVKMPHPITESPEIPACHSCGSQDLERRGYALTLNGRYQRFRCRQCGSWHRGTERISSSPIRAL